MFITFQTVSKSANKGPQRKYKVGYQIFSGDLTFINHMN